VEGGRLVGRAGRGEREDFECGADRGWSGTCFKFRDRRLRSPKVSASLTFLLPPSPRNILRIVCKLLTYDRTLTYDKKSGRSTIRTWVTRK